MNVDRIMNMEQRLERADVALRAMEKAYALYEEVQKDIEILDAYLGSEQWHADRADDEAGLLPPNIKRGVLGEDGIWDLLERNREIKTRLKNL